MGKLAKAFGLDKKGKIGLTVSKPAYIAGELVSGTIYVDIHEPIECDGKMRTTIVTLFRLNILSSFDTEGIGSGEGRVHTRSTRI